MKPQERPARLCAGRASALKSAVPLFLFALCTVIASTNLKAAAQTPPNRDQLLQSPTDNYVAGMEFMESWQSKHMPLKVYYHQASDVPGYDAHYVDEFKSACDAWTSATDGKICFQTTDEEKDADIDVKWIAQNTTNWVHTLGETTPIWTAGDGINHASISFITSMGKRPVGLKAMKWAAMHELGHALGLGHSLRKTDVMYKTMSIPSEKESGKAEIEPRCQNINLTSRDATTMNVVYAAKKIIDGCRAKGLDTRNMCHDLTRSAANCIKNGDSGSAIIILNEIIRLDKTYSVASENLMAAYYNCGAALYNKHCYEEARQLLEKSMEIGRRVGDQASLRTIASVYRNCQGR